MSKHEWILGVVDDLTAYAVKNDLWQIQHKLNVVRQAYQEDLLKFERCETPEASEIKLLATIYSANKKHLRLVHTTDYSPLTSSS